MRCLRKYKIIRTENFTVSLSLIQPPFVKFVQLAFNSSSRVQYVLLFDKFKGKLSDYLSYLITKM